LLPASLAHECTEDAHSDAFPRKCMDWDVVVAGWWYFVDAGANRSGTDDAAVSSWNSSPFSTTT